MVRKRELGFYSASQATRSQNLEANVDFDIQDSQAPVRMILTTQANTILQVSLVDSPDGQAPLTLTIADAGSREKDMVIRSVRTDKPVVLFF